MSVTPDESQEQEGAFLGTTAKSSSAPPKTTPGAARALRYQAQSHARHILTGEARKKAPGKFAGDYFRTVDCRYVRHDDVSVQYSAVHEAAHYAGLVTCGSVWACPICASRIQERRRLEIEQAIQWAKAQGLVPVLVTLTFPHRAWQSLAELILQQRDAFKRFRSGRLWMKVKPIGLIRSLEVTHGLNGWHPHTHELWFCDPQTLPGENMLTSLWERACAAAGLLNPNDADQVAAFRRHSVDVKDNMTAGDYLAKQDDSRSWGFSHEVAKATSKLGRAKGVHPHRFLVRQDPGDAERYIEYVEAMKGARQLYWSKGLKARVGVGDMSDEEVAQESREPAEILGSLSLDDWTVIRSNDARAEVLDAAENGGWPAVQSILAMLRV